MQLFTFILFVILLVSNSANADNRNKILHTDDLINVQEVKDSNESMEKNDLYDKAKFHFWSRAFLANYSSRGDIKNEIEYKFKNTGVIVAANFKPKDTTLLGLAYIKGNGEILVTKIFNAQLNNNKFNITSQGFAFFNGFITPIGLRFDNVSSFHQVNIDTTNDNLKFFLKGGAKAKAFLVDTNIKAIVDLALKNNISIHPYLGLGYSTMISNDLSHLNESNAQLYNSWSGSFGISIWKEYKIQKNKLYPGIYAQYEIPLNAKKSEPMNLSSNFSFGNKFNVGGSLYYCVQNNLDLELGYNFDLNSKLRGSNYFLKLKLDL